MQRVTKLDRFEIKIIRERIVINDKNEKIEVLPAEGDKIRRLITIAEGMESFKVLPPYIDSSPWRIEFKEDNTVTLLNKVDSNFLNLSWQDLATINKVILNGTNMALDEKKLHPSKRAQSIMSSLPDDATENL